VNWWKQTFKKALGVKEKPNTYIPFAEPAWKDYSENPYRVVYALQMKAGVEKATLSEFLVNEWLPALGGVKGCEGVELVNDFAEGSGYILLELWETKHVHDEGIRRLWHGTHKHVLAKLKELAEFAFLWEGITVERQHVIASEARQSRR
jgi:hypothetical protein